jgi:hypothetical protein
MVSIWKPIDKEIICTQEKENICYKFIRKREYSSVSGFICIVTVIELEKVLV